MSELKFKVGDRVRTQSDPTPRIVREVHGESCSVSDPWEGAAVYLIKAHNLIPVPKFKVGDKVVKEDIQNVTLYTEPAVEGLYRTIGFETMDTATGMAFRHQRNARRVRGSRDTAR